uniref:Serine/threonine protein kinase n=1 Tax=Gongylonema pulchrum TaxID=637853 RepID=A0A183D9K2_9BILA
LLANSLSAAAAGSAGVVTQATGLATAATHPLVTTYSVRNGPIFPAVTSQPDLSAKQECYVELSRLPSELLRPAALEQFL